MSEQALRQISSIFLLGLLLYNMVGYSIVYLSEQRFAVSEAGRQFVEAGGAGEIVLKIPVSVPYQTDWDMPEPSEGQIEHEGHFYQMKSRQLLSDTLYVRCAYDQSARDRFSDLVSKINDQVTGHATDPQKASHAGILKHFLKEYMGQGKKHTFFLLEWAPANVAAFAAQQLVTAENSYSVPSPPPDLA